MTRPKIRWARGGGSGRPRGRPDRRARARVRGRGGRPVDDEDRALIEGGEGVEEGFETAERDLREAATHGENRYDPAALDFGDEESAGDGDAESGEADEVDAAETSATPSRPGSTPWEGPGLIRR